MRETKKVQLGPKELEIPTEWEVSDLGSLCNITTGDKDVNEGNPEGKFPFFTCSTSHTYSDNYSFDTEALLIAGNGDVGHTEYYNGKFEAYQRTYVLDNFQNVIKYVYFYLKYALIKRLKSRKIGSTMPYIKKSVLDDFSFPLPPLSEQKKIAEVLGAVVEAIDKTNQIIEKSKKLKKGLMQDLLTKGIGHEGFKEVQLGPKKLKMPTGWSKTSIGDVATYIPGSTFPSKEQGKSEGEVPFYKVSDMNKSDVYMENSNNYISKKTADRLNATICRPGTVIFPKLGEALLTNKRRKLSTPAIFDNNVAGLYGNNINKDFLYYILLNINFDPYANPGTVPSINKSTINGIEIPIPPLPEQKEIANILSAVDEKIQQEREYKEKLQELKKGLMQDLLTGKVRVTNLIKQ